MSYKVHLSPDGVWRRCSAKPGNCKFGGEEGHKSFANEQEFKDWEEAENRKEFGIAGKIKNILTNDKKPKVRSSFVGEDGEAVKVQGATRGHNPFTGDDGEDVFFSDKEEADRFISNRNGYKLSKLTSEDGEEYIWHATYEEPYYDDKSLYNTDNYIEDEDYTYAREALEYVISEKIVKPRGQVEAWAVRVERSSPRYGYMANHGAVGFGAYDGGDLAEAILRFSGGNDSYQITDEDGVVKVSYNHHDGSDIAEFRPVTKSKVDKFWDIRHNSSHDEIIEYIEELPELKVKK